MNKFLFAGALGMFAFACTSTQNPSQEPEGAEAVVTDIFNYYGDTLTPENVMTIAELYAAIEGKDSIEAKVEARIIQTCRMKGCWMTLETGDGDQMRVRFKDYGFFVPTEGADGKMAIIEGIAFPDTISVDHLKHLAEDAEKSPEEIAAITEPEIGVNFEARGVIIKN